VRGRQGRVVVMVPAIGSLESVPDPNSVDTRSVTDRIRVSHLKSTLAWLSIITAVASPTHSAVAVSTTRTCFHGAAAIQFPTTMR